MRPLSHPYPDVTISASIDNLYNMAIGVANPDRLFVTGQLKVEGNISKGAEMRYMISPYEGPGARMKRAVRKGGKKK